MLKPRVFRLSGTWAGSATVIVVIVLILTMAPASQWAWIPAFPALFVAVLAYCLARTSIEVTQDDVIVRDASQPVQRARRDRIASLHRHSYWMVFADERGKRVVRSRGGYSPDQIDELARTLGIPFVDHVKGHGIRGRLFG